MCSHQTNIKSRNKSNGILDELKTITALQNTHYTFNSLIFKKEELPTQRVKYKTIDEMNLEKDINHSNNLSVSISNCGLIKLNKTNKPRTANLVKGNGKNLIKLKKEFPIQAVKFKTIDQMNLEKDNTQANKLSVSISNLNCGLIKLNKANKPRTANLANGNSKNLNKPNTRTISVDFNFNLKLDLKIQNNPIKEKLNEKLVKAANTFRENPSLKNSTQFPLIKNSQKIIGPNYLNYENMVMNIKNKYKKKYTTLYNVSKIELKNSIKDKQGKSNTTVLHNRTLKYVK